MPVGFSIRQHSLLPELIVQPWVPPVPAQGGQIARINWVPGTTATFTLRAPNGQSIIRHGAAAALNDGGYLILQYNWSPGDTDVAGLCIATFTLNVGGHGVLLEWPVGSGNDFQIMIEPTNA